MWIPKKLVEITAQRVIEMLLSDKEYREQVKSAVLRDTERIKVNDNEAYLKDMVNNGK